MELSLPKAGGGGRGDQGLFGECKRVVLAEAWGLGGLKKKGRGGED